MVNGYVSCCLKKKEDGKMKLKGCALKLKLAQIAALEVRGG